MRGPSFLTNLALAVVMIAGFSLVNNSGAVASPARAGGSVTFATWGSSPVEKAAQQALIKQFQSKYGITVNYEELNGDYNVQLKSRITAGTAPDVFYINSDHIQDYITTGALKDLTFLTKAKSLGFPSQFYKNLQAGYNYKGKPYAVVKDVSTLALFYNKSMFKAAGIKSPPKTWAQLKSDACKLTDKSKKVTGISMANDPARFVPFLLQAGGNLLKKGKPSVNSAAGKAALTFYTSITKSGCALRPDQSGASWQGEAFGKGLAAMAIEGNWLSSPMHETYPSINYGVAPLPKGPKGPGNLAFTAGYAMFARTKNLSNATKFLEFLVSKQGTTIWTHQALYVPPRRDVKSIPNTGVFTSQIKVSKDWFFPPGFADRALGPIGDDIRKVQDGQLSVSAALQDMQQKETAALSSAP